MRTLVFDIETIGEEWSALDETTQHMLTRWIDRTAKSDEEHTAQLADLQDGLGFSPLTGSIVAIGLYDLEQEKGVVYYRTDDTLADDLAEGAVLLKVRSEKQMLEDFWAGAKAYDAFVTFNGRGFDVPFLLLRSAILGVKPTRDLMDGRYLYQQKGAKHIDLADQLSFYGAVFKKASLHLYCRAFGIESPKAAGVTGDDVSALFREGKYETIARYNVRDIIATTELYKKWQTYLSPSAFRNFD
ncbi:ribonuclease H-like domain-containing protein [Candidatus Kaiserbacteria bacterium]|nr:ribonuclease H-like domain-containing protein [Candidatus Kaiserbacteria bacterium]